MCLEVLVRQTNTGFCGALLISKSYLSAARPVLPSMGFYLQLSDGVEVCLVSAPHSVQ